MCVDGRSGSSYVYFRDAGELRVCACANVTHSLSGACYYLLNLSNV